MPTGRLVTNALFPEPRASAQRAMISAGSSADDEEARVEDSLLIDSPVDDDPLIGAPVSAAPGDGASTTSEDDPRPAGLVKAFRTPSKPLRSRKNHEAMKNLPPGWDAPRVDEGQEDDEAGPPTSLDEVLPDDGKSAPTTSRRVCQTNAARQSPPPPWASASSVRPRTRRRRRRPSFRRASPIWSTSRTSGRPSPPMQARPSSSLRSISPRSIGPHQDPACSPRSTRP
jgi:hypothetical protein